MGDTAPDFTRKYFDGRNLKDVERSDYRGLKNVVLAFYLFAFTGGGTQPRKNFRQNLQKREAAATQALGVSMDSAFANETFADPIGVTFPLLSDWGGKVTYEDGIYKEQYRAARRVNFLVGPKMKSQSGIARLATTVSRFRTDGKKRPWRNVAAGVARKNQGIAAPPLYYLY